MDIPVILIRITGGIIFLWTLRSIVLHIKKESKEAKSAHTQSKSERFLNGIILYLWLIFITAFSLGMIFNN